VITKLTIPYGSNMAGLIDFVFGPGEKGEDGRTHAFPRPATVMLSEIRRDLEILSRLRLVGHCGRGAGVS